MRDKSVDQTMLKFYKEMRIFPSHIASNNNTNIWRFFVSRTWINDAIKIPSQRKRTFEFQTRYGGERLYSLSLGIFVFLKTFIVLSRVSFLSFHIIASLICVWGHNDNSWIKTLNEFWFLINCSQWTNLQEKYNCCKELWVNCAELE